MCSVAMSAPFQGACYAWMGVSFYIGRRLLGEQKVFAFLLDHANFTFSITQTVWRKLYKQWKAMPMYLFCFHGKSQDPLWEDTCQRLSSVTGAATQCKHLSFLWERKTEQGDTYFRMHFSHSQHRARCYWSASQRIWGLVQWQKHFIN